MYPAIYAVFRPAEGDDPALRRPARQDRPTEINIFNLHYVKKRKQMRFTSAWKAFFLAQAACTPK